MVATAQMVFALEAGPNQFFSLAIQGRFVCHYLDILKTSSVGR